MKVSQPPLNPALQAEKAKEVQSNTTQKDSTKARNLSSSEEAIAISEDAKLMQKASELAKESKDMRAERVLDLKKQVQDGTYVVDSRRVAERIVDEHLNTDFGKNNI